tara:strand:+ start:13493 stop:13663 length:171 start_codon:yes stop_codon:yes gene_type:complete
MVFAKNAVGYSITTDQKDIKDEHATLAASSKLRGIRSKKQSTTLEANAVSADTVNA